jgi:DNA-binding MarR family transcriptional regulator
MTGEDNLLKLVEAAPDPQPPDGYRLQDQIGFVLRKAHQRHVAHIADLTPPQFATLAKLRDVGEISQNQLGQLIAMDAATVKGVIDRLKARGYVALSRHAGDKRRLLVSLTAEGHTAIAALIPEAQAISQETMAALTPREAETLLRLLNKLT